MRSYIRATASSLSPASMRLGSVELLWLETSVLPTGRRGSDVRRVLGGSEVLAPLAGGVTVVDEPMAWDLSSSHLRALLQQVLVLSEPNLNVRSRCDAGLTSARAPLPQSVDWACLLMRWRMLY